MAGSNKSAAKEATNTLAEHVSEQTEKLKDAYNQTVANVSEKADDWTAQTGSKLHAWGDQLQENYGDCAAVGPAAQMIGDKLRAGGEYLEDSKFQGMIDDFAKLIKRHPLPSVAVAVGLGWYLARRRNS